MQCSTSTSDCAAKDSLDMRRGDDKSLAEVNDTSNNTGVNYCSKSPRLQKGVLRTNCIDCLDRTNVAQYAYGLVALGHQLQALGLINTPVIEIYSSLADDLMKIYEEMGDTLALQYGGSPAHNKVISFRIVHDSLCVSIQGGEWICNYIEFPTKSGYVTIYFQLIFYFIFTIRYILAEFVTFFHFCNRYSQR